MKTFSKNGRCENQEMWQLWAHKRRRIRCNVLLQGLMDSGNKRVRSVPKMD